MFLLKKRAPKHMSIVRYSDIGRKRSDTVDHARRDEALRNFGAKLRTVVDTTRKAEPSSGPKPAQRSHGLRRRLLACSCMFGAVIAAHGALIWEPRVGVYMLALTIALLMGVAVRSDALRKIAVSLSLIPVADLALAGFQPHTPSGILLAFDSLLLVLALIYRSLFTHTHTEQTNSLLVRQYLLYVPAVLISGLALGCIGYLLLGHHYPFGGLSIAWVMLGAAVAAAAEEMLLRGLIQQQAARVFHPLVAALSSAALYTILTLGQNSVLTLPIAALTGLALALTFYAKRNVLLTLIMNTTAKLVYVGLVAYLVVR